MSAPEIVNRALSAMPDSDRGAVMQSCILVELEFGTLLGEPEQILHDVYFPVGDFISLDGDVITHLPLELGMIGDEGMLGSTLALRVDLAPHRAVVQGAGGHCARAATLLGELSKRPHFKPCSAVISTT